jgi:predicted flavoprotein YhiN
MCNVRQISFSYKRLQQLNVIYPLYDCLHCFTTEWFRSRGVALKTEADGRMFPTTDSSQTIIDCLATAAQTSGVR